MDLIQLKIKMDASVIKYVKIIREFDGSMSMGDIKRKIENGDFAVEFDLEEYDVLDDLNGIDRKQGFRRMLDSLLNAGSRLEIYHDGEPSSLEFLDNWLESLEITRRQVEEDMNREAEAGL